MNGLGSVIAALLAGLVFGLGLIISGMADPAKVQNFLDVFGTWDPSLALVMGGAVAVAGPGFWLAGRRIKPLFADVFQWPTARQIDSRLVTGAGTFGVGWGLSGFCPGPAIAAVPLMAPGTLAFIPAMLAGMWFGKMAASGRGLVHPSPSGDSRA